MLLLLLLHMHDTLLLQKVQLGSRSSLRVLLRELQQMVLLLLLLQEC